MILSKEKSRLEKLLVAVNAVNIDDEANVEALNELVSAFSEGLMTLYRSHSNTFANIVNYDLAEIRNNKRIIKKNAIDPSKRLDLVVYKESVVHAIERTLEYIDAYL